VQYQKEAAQIVDAWFDGFVTAIVSLEANPRRFAVCRESDAFPFELRQLLYGVGKRKTHRALFVVHKNRVVVHAIRHLSQRDLIENDF